LVHKGAAERDIFLVFITEKALHSVIATPGEEEQYSACYHSCDFYHVRNTIPADWVLVNN
jgi:hypothetical protein